GYEFELARVAMTEFGPSSVLISHVLRLPSGWTLDTSELSSPVEGISRGTGRLTLVDEGGVPRVRFSAVDVGALGGPTVLQNSDTFLGRTRLSQELQASPQVATVGPPDLVGNNFAGGIEPPLVQTAYFLEENMPDTTLGLTEVQPLIVDGPPAFRVTMIAP